MPPDTTPLAPPPAKVAEVFDAMPPPSRILAMELRALVLTVATERGIKLEETLKWGEPAYLPGPGGTTVRIGPDKAGEHVKLLVNCRTSLIDDWRKIFDDRLTFEGSRAVLVPVAQALDTDALALCIASALTYHQKKRAR